MTVRTSPVVFKAGAGITLAFEPGDVVLLSQEEADRVIAAGLAVPGRLVYHAATARKAKETKP